MLWRSITIVLFGLGIIVTGFGCGGEQRSEAAADRRAAAPAVDFTDVTQQAGLGAFRHNTGGMGEKWYPETVGGGGAFLDYDGDGWLDILLVEGGNWRGYPRTPSLRLYRNRGGASFEDRTAEAGLVDVSTYAFGVATADYDNDGDDDFFLTTLYENLLFRNDEAVFAEVGSEAGIADRALWSTAAVFFDADRDGWLDLYVGNYVEWSPETDIRCTHNGVDKSFCGPYLYKGVPGCYYHSNRDGTFTEQTVVAGFGGSPGKTLGVAELDFNRDGWSDLVVANDTQRDLLYKNNGDGTFVEIGAISGIAYDENGLARAGMGVDAGDVDNSGQTTIFVANYAEEMIGVYTHAGDGLFVNRSASSRIGRPSLATLGFGLFLFDVDLDGYLDLFVANGHVDDMVEQIRDNTTYRQYPQMFVNLRNRTFQEVASGATGLPGKELVARGAAYGDFDRDGDQDILLIENGGPAYLWRNELNSGSALRVYVEGTASNKAGVGAEVIAFTLGIPETRRIRTGGSYLSQSERVATIGLAGRARVDSLFVSWPSGREDRYYNVPGGQAVLLREGLPAVETLYTFGRDPS